MYLKGLAKGLVAEGHKVTLLGTGEWPSDQWPGEILRCEGRTLAVYEQSIIAHRKSHSFDLLISVEKIPGCDIYRTDEGVHAAWLKLREPFLSPLRRFFQRISAKHREKLRAEQVLYQASSTRRVIALSDSIREEIIRRYGYPGKRITVVRNGVRILRSGETWITRAQARSALGIGEEEKILLFVGTGWERKGLGFAIRATEALADPKVKVLVAGQGPVHRYKSPSAKFLGPVGDMETVYAAADLMIFPTIYDPFPLAALEALSAGLPVITTLNNGVSEVMVLGLHGEAVKDPSDVVVLSEVVRGWLERMKDPEEADRIRMNCVSLAKQFTLERNLRETLQVIHEVIEEKRVEGP
jgi:UDP-glucose:(heptosyl)LPS alpha-1,3-glucosyltransferase